jgi:VIT1/CCC1 family predicted Fe2+/Mn2+ transporter
MSSNALKAHARDELGITESLRARPIQAAFASAISFSLGGIIPIATVLLAPSAWVTEIISATAIVTLALLGGIAAYAGGAAIAKGAMRVACWGALAMGLTAGVGKFFGAAV